MPKMSRLRIVALLVPAWSTLFAAPGRAFETELPDVGTMINYTFNPPEHVLDVAQDVSSDAAFTAEAMFADDKSLRKRTDAAYISHDFIVLDVILRGPGIQSALLDVYRFFDEQASLIGPDGSIIETARNNHSYGYGDFDDFFTFGWQFETPGNLNIHGFVWQISPDIVPGRQLPPTLSIEATLWGSPMTVVPEPAAATMAVAILLLLAARRRRLHGAA